MTENKNLPFLRRLSFALQGLRLSWRGESSFRTHVIIALVVIIAAALIRPAPLWWALLAIAIAAVLAAELLNTAIERLADHVRPEFDEEIRIVKDAAAAAVLIASCSAIVVAIAFAAEHFLR
jgi:diacylglycerol kinase (ATP)